MTLADHYHRLWASSAAYLTLSPSASAGALDGPAGCTIVGFDRGSRRHEQLGYRLATCQLPGELFSGLVHRQRERTLCRPDGTHFGIAKWVPPTLCKYRLPGNFRDSEEALDSYFNVDEVNEEPAVIAD